MPDDPDGLVRFNSLDDGAAIRALLGCCSSSAWASAVARARPFPRADALLAHADRVLADLPESDIDEALAGHPRIGDRPDNPSSAREQSGVTGSGADVLAELREANAAYEHRFGHVYLVFADGRPAEELLAILNERIHHDPATERRILRGELARINRARLVRMLADETATTKEPRR